MFKSFLYLFYRPVSLGVCPQVAIYLLVVVVSGCKARSSKLQNNQELLIEKHNKPFELGESFVGNSDVYPSRELGSGQSLWGVNEWLVSRWKPRWENTQVVGYEDSRVGVYNYAAYIRFKFPKIINAKTPREKKLVGIYDEFVLEYELNTKGSPNIARTFLMLVKEGFFDQQKNKRINRKYPVKVDSSNYQGLFSLVPSSTDFLAPIVRDNDSIVMLEDIQTKKIAAIRLGVSSLKFSSNAVNNDSDCSGFDSTYRSSYMYTFGSSDDYSGTRMSGDSGYFYQQVDSVLTVHHVLSGQDPLGELDLLLPSTALYGALPQQHDQLLAKIRGETQPNQQPSHDKHASEYGSAGEGNRNFGADSIDTIRRNLNETDFKALEQRIIALKELRDKKKKDKELKKAPAQKSGNGEVEESSAVPRLNYSNMRVNPMTIYLNATTSLANYYCNFKKNPPVLLAKFIRAVGPSSISREEFYQKMIDAMQRFELEIAVADISVRRTGFTPIDE